MILLATALFAALTTTEALTCLLNKESSCGAPVYRRALEYVEKEAESGRPLQQFVIGVLTDDKEKSRRYLENSRPQILALAEKKNNPLAWYLLSVEKNDMKLLRRAADGNNVQALNALGSIVLESAFKKENLTAEELTRAQDESYGYFRRAAAKRDPNGFVNLGACYLRGFGCAVDMELAFRCFESAAKLGHPEGMDNLSACYQFGHGVAMNTERSLFWAMKARAVRGDAGAERWLRERK